MMSNFIVYSATNPMTGEVYVGATTKTLNERRLDHCFKASNDSNLCFHKAIKTYGYDSFKWEIVDYANTLNELANKESFYIAKFDSFRNGYNSDNGGGFKKIIYQFDRELNLINTYDSLSDAGNAVNANKKCISNASLGYSLSCKGFYWSYSDSFNKKLEKRKKKVLQFSLDGEFINFYESASEASRKTGISKTCITRCCRNERSNSGGFLWKYS